MKYPKSYVVDTSVLLDDPNAIFKLRNGSENDVYIPYHVLLELNKFKKSPKHGSTVGTIIQHLLENPGKFKILNSCPVSDLYANLVDNHILKEIQSSGLESPILVTNDKVFQLQADLRGIKSEGYKASAPSKSEAESYTGFVASRENAASNSFLWGNQGKPIFLGPKAEKVIDYRHRIWNVVPRNIYQNLFLELLVNEHIHIVSVQSEAGYGKSFLALAVALYLVLELKSYDKIYVVKPMIEIGQKLGYLPGGVDEKMAPYTRYISELVLKLHRLRPANRLFTDTQKLPLEFNSRRFEIMPLNYIRGMNIENAVVIIDEIQNMSRAECRALLSRMGEGVKCFCLGDIHQVDNPYLNVENNGLNWMVNRFKGSDIYAHLMLKGDKSRGPITDLVIKSGF